MNTITERDILALSSGTIAVITGYHRYEDIDNVHTDFCTYVHACLTARGRLRRTWNSWREAWNDFNAYRRFAYPRYCPEHYYTPLVNSGFALCPRCEMSVAA